MHKKAALWTHTGSTYRVILCAVSSWSGFSWSNFQCFMSPCYFLFSQGFSPKLFCSGSVFTTWQVPYSFLFTSTLLHDFYLPSVFQIVLLADLASLSDSCSPSHFHLHAMWPSLSLWSQSQNETQGTGRVFPFPTSIVSSLLGGLLSCWSLRTNWDTGPFNTQLHWQ